MNFNNNSSLCVCVLIFLSTLKMGSSLECYHCNIMLHYFYNYEVYGPCQGIVTLEKCQDPAVCITVVYMYIQREPYTRTNITVMKGCYPDMAGAECNKNFMTNITNDGLTPRNINFNQTCETCNDNGCNHAPVQKLVRNEMGYSDKRGAFEIDLGHRLLPEVSILCFVPFTMRMLL